MRRFREEIISELKELKNRNLLRKMEVLNSGDFPYIIINNKKLINFSSNNYLSLNGHSYIKVKMSEAEERWGTSASASRLISGNLQIFEEAEEKLARFKGKESALIFNSGYQANVSIISTLMKDGDAIFSDELNHASIIDGCRLSKARVYIYRHNDINHLEDLLKKSDDKKKLIVTDGVFSMDGDTAKLPEIVYLSERYETAVIVDDAHSTGVLGEKGRGTEEHFKLKKENVMVLGTGGKALGVTGAFFSCPKYIRDFLINKCRGFIYSTAQPPSVPAGLMASLELVDKESFRRERLKELSEYFYEKLKTKGFAGGTNPSHITPLIVGESEKALYLERLLREKGVFARAIRYPTVPEGTARIRFSITAEHTKEDIDRVINIIEKGWKS
ncbi:MAG: 8-amino-7-oxononanoate synthase [Proteobacteria bacterium]|nr:8-amino-7-oxononanoate synthase [Pseudomonadota bacterium]